MLRLRRKIFIDTLVLGVALTLMVLVAGALGFLDSLENWFYDQRALRCQFFNRPPTTQLVHLDLDDRALEVIGKWPWPRSKFAAILDELGRAKPKVVATDIIFPDAEGTTGEVQPDGSFKAIDGDAMFAAALKRLERVIVPAALFTGSRVESPLATALLADLTENLELTEPELLERMRRRGFQSPAYEAQIAALFYPIRREAAFARVYQLLVRQSATQPTTQAADAVRTLLHVPAEGIDYSSPLMNIVRSEYGHAAAIVALRHLTAPAPADVPPIRTAYGSYFAPLLPFSKAASGTGFVDFSSDGVVRNVPMLAEHDGRIYPQLGLSLALRALDVDIRTVRITADRITIPRPDGRAIVIPVRTGTTGIKERGIPMLMDIPWFGNRDWETMYDAPGHKERRQHVTIIKLWQVGQLERKIRSNNANADMALSVLLAKDADYKLGLKEDVAKEYFAHVPSLDDSDARRALATMALKELAESGLEKTFADMAKTGELKPDEKLMNDEMLGAKRALTLLLKESDSLARQLAGQRAELAKEFGGKAVLIGWTATGAAADFVPTPLHDKCPGVVVHGAVFNAVMTNQFWHRTPAWVVGVITVAFGMLTAMAAVGFSALRGLVFVLLLLGGYLMLISLLFFGYFDLLIGTAGPVLAIGFVWAMCTLYRIIVETREREHIKARFQTYADPLLVDHVLEHPEKIRFDGEKKELTVVFTDLANFTTLSERLGEKSVTLLNDYLGRMVPIIGKYRGFVNKFLGDGIMFFYGAPTDNPAHAIDAVRTTLEMQAAMVPLNEEMAAQGFPHLTVRAGVSTGEMVVGDAGTTGRSDYTVLGDAVNLGSRLESANKYLGTRVMVSGRTAQAAAGQFLFRPLGRLRVVGKTEGVEVFEAICPLDEAGDVQKKSVALAREMVDAYQAQRLEACLYAIDAMDAWTGGPTKLTALYRSLCEKYLTEPPEAWDGTISLTEK